MDYGELVYACAISRIFNYDCLGARCLIDKISSPSDVFSLSVAELTDLLGHKSRYADEFLDNSILKRSEQEVEWAVNHGVRIYYIKDSDYPYRLRECADAPIVLFYRGTADLNSSGIVSIVGTRRATPYGLGMCEQIMEGLSNLNDPPVIVSGLALGIDICAHKAALRLGLDTVGVMATGLDKIYPQKHRDIAVDMVEHGGILSEYFSQTVPLALNFIRRNRIIAGLSDATVLIESGEEGGGVITSRMAFDYSRDVFAVPGKITDELSKGCNNLIKNNIACCVNNIDVIGREMGWKKSLNNSADIPKLLTFDSDNQTAKRIVKLLSSYDLLDVDEISKAAECPLREVVQNLTDLEMAGRVVSDVSGRFSLIR